MASKVKNSLVNVNPLRALRKALSMGNVQNNHPRVVKMYDNWKKIYRRQIHTRFKSASSGDGTWTPLALSTVQRKKSSLILVETRTLINAVDPDIYNAPGSVGQRTNSGLLIGYGGTVVHPTSLKNKRSTTIAEIAEFHQIGGGKLPKRTIIVAPTRETIDLVTAEIKAATQDIIKENSL